MALTLKATKMTVTFPTKYIDILEKLNQVDAIAYGHTRNYLAGAVTQLSPYLFTTLITWIHYGTKEKLVPVFYYWSPRISTNFQCVNGL